MPINEQFFQGSLSNQEVDAVIKEILNPNASLEDTIIYLRQAQNAAQNNSAYGYLLLGLFAELAHEKDFALASYSQAWEFKKGDAAWISYYYVRFSHLDEQMRLQANRDINQLSDEELGNANDFMNAHPSLPALALFIKCDQDLPSFLWALVRSANAGQIDLAAFNTNEDEQGIIQGLYHLKSKLASTTAQQVLNKFKAFCLLAALNHSLVNFLLKNLVTEDLKNELQTHISEEECTPFLGFAAAKALVPDLVFKQIVQVQQPALEEFLPELQKAFGPKTKTKLPDFSAQRYQLETSCEIYSIELETPLLNEAKKMDNFDKVTREYRDALIATNKDNKERIFICGDGKTNNRLRKFYQLIDKELPNAFILDIQAPFFPTLDDVKNQLILHILSQAQHYACQKPNQKLLMQFHTRSDAMLWQVCILFFNNSHSLPYNVQIELFHYQGALPNKIGHTIQGQGCIDRDYQSTIEKFYTKLKNGQAADSVISEAIKQQKVAVLADIDEELALDLPFEPAPDLNPKLPPEQDAEEIEVPIALQAPLPWDDESLYLKLNQADPDRTRDLSFLYEKNDGDKSEMKLSVGQSPFAHPAIIKRMGALLEIDKQKAKIDGCKTLMETYLTKAKIGIEHFNGVLRMLFFIKQGTYDQHFHSKTSIFNTSPAKTAQKYVNNFFSNLGTHEIPNTSSFNSFINLESSDAVKQKRLTKVPPQARYQVEQDNLIKDLKLALFFFKTVDERIKLLEEILGSEFFSIEGLVFQSIKSKKGRDSWFNLKKSVQNILEEQRKKKIPEKMVQEAEPQQENFVLQVKKPDPSTMFNAILALSQCNTLLQEKDLPNGAEILAQRDELGAAISSNTRTFVVNKTFQFFAEKWLVVPFSEFTPCMEKLRKYQSILGEKVFNEVSAQLSIEENKFAQIFDSIIPKVVANFQTQGLDKNESEKIAAVMPLSEYAQSDILTEEERALCSEIEKGGMKMPYFAHLAALNDLERCNLLEPIVKLLNNYQTYLSHGEWLPWVGLEETPDVATIKTQIDNLWFEYLEGFYQDKGNLEDVFRTLKTHQNYGPYFVINEFVNQTIFLARKRLFTQQNYTFIMQVISIFNEAKGDSLSAKKKLDLMKSVQDMVLIRDKLHPFFTLNIEDVNQLIDSTSLFLEKIAVESQQEQFLDSLGYMVEILVSYEKLNLILIEVFTWLEPGKAPGKVKESLKSLDKEEYVYLLHHLLPYFQHKVTRLRMLIDSILKEPKVQTMLSDNQKTKIESINKNIFNVSMLMELNVAYDKIGAFILQNCKGEDFRMFRLSSLDHICIQFLYALNARNNVSKDLRRIELVASATDQVKEISTEMEQFLKQVQLPQNKKQYPASLKLIIEINERFLSKLPADEKKQEVQQASGL